MTVDREQIRRDAEAMVAIHGDNAKLAHACLRVLAELEQAEWERDGERTRVNFLTSALAEAEAQLAKAPALVEDAPPPRDPTDDDWPTWEENFYRCPNTSAWVYRWSEDRIVAAYEQEQKP